MENVVEDIDYKEQVSVLEDKVLEYIKVDLFLL
jgi:hypothetical protein